MLTQEYVYIHKITIYLIWYTSYSIPSQFLVCLISVKKKLITLLRLAVLHQCRGMCAPPHYHRCFLTSRRLHLSHHK